MCAGKMKWYFILITVFMYSVSVLSNQCLFAMSGDFKKCSNRADELASFRETTLNRIHKLSDITDEVCPVQHPCRRLLKVSRIALQSFSSKMFVHISQMLRRCCGPCAKIYRTVIAPLSDSNLTELRNFDIIYPVASRSPHVTGMFGFFFIPVFEVPSAFYISHRISDSERTLSMIEGCVSNWPLLIICLLMTLIAGFVAWIIETWNNPDEFPRSFARGVMEGFWWSFISMTTVGYGDKSPRSFPARLFAVLWILVGITISSIYIGRLSSQIINAQDTQETDLSGKRIGSLANSLHDSIMITQHGGREHTVEFNNTVDAIIHMMQLLDQKIIHGFLLSRPIYYYFLRKIEEDERYKKVRKEIGHLHRVEKTFRRGQMVTGMLIKEKDEYHYFKKYFEDNWLQVQGCYMASLNYKEEKFAPSESNPIIGLFVPFFKISIGVLGFILFFGFCYEGWRRYFEKLTQDPDTKLSLSNGQMELITCS